MAAATGGGTDDDASEYRSRYASYLSMENFSRFEKSMESAARNNHKRKMKILLDLLKEKNLNLFRCLPSMSTILHTAIQFTDSGYDTVNLLIHYYPQLLVQVKPTIQQSVLHIAIAKQDIAGVGILLQGLAENDSTTRLAHKFLNMPLESKKGPELKDTCLEAELPLSIAAWNADLNMLEMLFKKGALMGTVNYHGDNVFHSLVAVAAKQECKTDNARIESLVQTFTKLISLARAKEQDNHYLSAALSAKNHRGLTPLAMAAKVGSSAIFDCIINCQGVYKFLSSVSDGVSNVYLYDVTEVDSAIISHQESVMELIMNYSTDRENDYFEFTEKRPIIDMIRLKWESYRRYYWLWAVIHVTIMISMSVSAIYQAPLINSTANSTARLGHYYRNPAHQVRAAFDVLVLLYCQLLLIAELKLIIKYRDFPNLFNSIGNGPYRVLLILLGLCMLVAFFLRIFAQPGETFPLVFCVVLGWTFTLFFSRGLRKFSYFTVMIQSAIFGDMMRFCAFYLIILLAFTVGMFVSVGSTNPPDQFETFLVSLFTMFQLTVGLVELSVFNQATYPALAVILFVLFILIVYILLLNMLIALLSDSCARVAYNKDSQWHLQKLSIVLYIESLLPQRLRIKCGKSQYAKLFSQPDDDTGYLPIGLDRQLLPKNLQPTRREIRRTMRYYIEIKSPTPNRNFSRLGSRTTADLQHSYPQSSQNTATDAQLIQQKEQIVVDSPHCSLPFSTFHHDLGKTLAPTNLGVVTPTLSNQQPSSVAKRYRVSRRVSPRDDGHTKTSDQNAC